MDLIFFFISAVNLSVKVIKLKVIKFFKIIIGIYFLQAV